MNKINIGIGIEAPKAQCADKHCPFHNGLKLRGRAFDGVIIKSDVHGTVTVEWPRLFYLSKYERYEKRRSRIRVHTPKCVEVKIGDRVRVMECKPISKTKHFVVVEKLQ